MSKEAKLFGEKMKQMRKTLDLSQDELAQELQISRISIANYEQGKQVPGLDAAIQIARKLGISIDQVSEEGAQLNLGNSLEKVSDSELKEKLKQSFAKAREDQG